MPLRVSVREQMALGWFLLKWLVLGVPLGIVAGSACTLFLWSLDAATSARFRRPDPVYLLRPAGIANGAAPLSFGRWD